MQPADSSAARTPGRRQEIAGIALVALAALAFVSLHSTAAGLFGAWLSYGLRWTLGWAADLVPAGGLVGGGFCLFGRRRGSRTGARLCGLLFLAGAALIAVDLVGPDSPISGPSGPQFIMDRFSLAPGALLWVSAGGQLGAWLSGLSRAVFGPTGVWIVLLAALGVGLVLVLETPLSPWLARLGQLGWQGGRGFFLAVWALLRALGEVAAGATAELADLFRLGRDRWALARQARLARRDARRGLADQGLGPVNRRSNPAGKASDAPARPAPDSGAPRAAERGGEGRPPAPQRRGAVAVQSAADVDGDAELEDEWREEPPPDATPFPKGAASAPGSRHPGHHAAAARQPVRPEGAPGAVQLPLPGAERVYRLPPVALLSRPREKRRGKAPPPVDQRTLLEETLTSFGVEAKVVSVSRGPVITRYELQPAAGVKVSRIVGLADDLALSLAAPDVRIEAPVPGKSVVGIEVPNQETSPVHLREVLESDAFTSNPSRLLIGLGKDIAGNPVVADLTRLLHLLIAGATGSGKSVCINTIIASLLYRALPDELKLLMIDPKRVELSNYDGIPHLIAPVVTDPKQAAGVLRWAVKEMERRYKLLSSAKVRNIDAYNRAVAQGELEGERLPYIAVIIDELADLMLVAQHEVEDSICRLTQMARAAGIHLIIATQRPSVDVITGLIKANVPSRIAFAVSSSVDSRTILDMAGAERLLGKGDMLFHPYGAGKPVRAQGAWIQDKEVQALVDFWRAQGQPQFEEAVLSIEAGGETAFDADDDLFDDAVRLVVERGQASVSMLQRRFRIGYARAGRLIEMMEERGIIGPAQGSKAREVLRAPADL